jgi:uncharacterized protein (DUF1015 family)
MAEVFPFRALRYDPARVELSQVVTQPYDKITPAMQERYYGASPYNLVRIILGKNGSGDDESNNVYTRAAASFAQWRKEAILLPDPEPAVYIYDQWFRHPLSGERCRRSGLIAAGRIEDYEAGVVFRHEQTLSAPKADRLNLLRATRAHFGQIFMLFTDLGEWEQLLFQRARASGAPPPDVAVQDEYGVEHKLWRVAEPETIARFQALLAGKKLVIADGHHRYETALQYRNQRRAQAGTIDAHAPYERVMMTFINTHGTGVLILPTHRVIHGLTDFQPGNMIEAARAFFTVRDVSSQFDPNRPAALLPETEPGETALLAVTRQQAFLLQADPAARHPALAGLSPQLAALDVVRLHKVLLQAVLGIGEQDVKEQKNLEYLRDAGEAVGRVRSGQADVAFLMNPVEVEQVTQLAQAGEVLPQKSTDFYPKLLSGLTIYALE